MFFFVDPVECLVLVYVVCDARAHGNLWMVIIVVSHLLCRYSVVVVCSVHERLSRTERLSQTAFISD